VTWNRNASDLFARKWLRAPATTEVALPLKDAVKEKWLYGNAARVFGLE
jgi:predicted TIM-barrel fold metal-dependent hydrolase